jgi:sulfotransferase family protein
MIGGYDNCVARKPTPRVLAALAFPLPWPLAIFHRLERIRLLEASLPEEDRLTESRAFEAIENGEPTPTLDDDFVLATSSAHPYLARLDALGTVLPDARIVVCVRDPYDTIASLKRANPERSVADLAHSWQHFAQLILSERDRLILVNYADLEAASPGDRSNLDESDVEEIRAICSEAAEELGLGE